MSQDNARELAARRLLDAARDYAAIDGRVRPKRSGFLMMAREDAELVTELLNSIKGKGGARNFEWSPNGHYVSVRLLEEKARLLYKARFLEIDEQGEP